MLRVEQSLTRRTAAYYRERALKRRLLKMRRQAESQASRGSNYDYKPPEAASVKGSPGACKCSALVKCATMACACRVAGVLCTDACHGGRPSLKCCRMSAPLPSGSDVSSGCATSSDASSAAGQGVNSDPESEILSELSCCEECDM